MRISRRESRQLGFANLRTRNSRIAVAISRAWVSSAKWPVSKKWISASGLSRVKALAPAGRKNGSVLPHTARIGGRRVRKVESVFTTSSLLEYFGDCRFCLPVKLTNGRRGAVPRSQRVEQAARRRRSTTYRG